MERGTGEGGRGAANGLEEACKTSLVGVVARGLKSFFMCSIGLCSSLILCNGFERSSGVRVRMSPASNVEGDPRSSDTPADLKGVKVLGRSELCDRSLWCLWGLRLLAPRTCLRMGVSSVCPWGSMRLLRLIRSEPPSEAVLPCLPFDVCSGVVGRDNWEVSSARRSVNLGQLSIFAHGVIRCFAKPARPWRNDMSVFNHLS